MANPRWAAILVPGGEVLFQDGVETLEGTNTDGRCDAAIELEGELREQGYERVQFFAIGTADHPRQVKSTARLITQRMNQRGKRVVYASEDNSWDTIGNVAVFRELLRGYGWWPRYRRPRASIFVASQEIHTKRFQVLFALRHSVLIHRYPCGEELEPDELKRQRFYLFLTWIPFLWYPMSWYTKRIRQAARAAAVQ